MKSILPEKQAPKSLEYSTLHAQNAETPEHNYELGANINEMTITQGGTAVAFTTMAMSAAARAGANTNHLGEYNLWCRNESGSRYVCIYSYCFIQ